MVPQSWRVGSTEPWWRHPAQINGGHTAGNRGAQNPAYRRASHFIFTPARTGLRGGRTSPSRRSAQLFGQWGACPRSSPVARSTVSGWLLSSDQTGCDAASWAVLRLRAVLSGALARDDGVDAVSYTHLTLPTNREV